MPDSPLINTVISEFDILPIALNTFCSEIARPTIFDDFLISFASISVENFSEALTAFKARALIVSRSKGFARYSKAPPLYADSALSISE